MNKNLFRAAVLSGLLPLMAPLGHAQSTAAQSDAAKREQAKQREDAFRGAMSAAADHARRGNFAAAEQALTRANSHKAGTPRWHLAAAEHLLHLAADLGQEGRTAAALALARSALGEIKLADKHPDASAQVRASAATLAGHIYERYFGDLVEAKARYQAAVEIESSAKQPAEALTRLSKAEVAK